MLKLFHKVPAVILVLALGAATWAYCYLAISGLENRKLHAAITVALASTTGLLVLYVSFLSSEEISDPIPVQGVKCVICETEMSYHHCVWLGRCIGPGNYRSFSILVALGVVTVGYMMGTGVASFFSNYLVCVESEVPIE